MSKTVPPGRPVAGRPGASLLASRSLAQRCRIMAQTGIAMMLHDKAKFAGTLLGVVFAVVLSNQQLGMFFGLMYKNTMFVRNAGADLWVIARGTEYLAPGKTLSLSDVMAARATPGVAWAEPLLYGTASVNLPGGGNEQVLAELEGGIERASLAAAEAELGGAKAELKRAVRGLRGEDIESIVADTESIHARAELSQLSLLRVEQLALAGATTAEQLDRARYAARADERAFHAASARRRAAVSGSRREDIQIARAKLDAAAARRDYSAAALDRILVRAPSDGVILQVKLRVGEYYKPGEEPLVVMGDTSRLHVRMDVDERDVGRLRLGARAIATSSAFPDRHIPGKVVEIGKRMGRKNVRTDDPVERIDTKILEVVIELADTAELVPGLRVMSFVETAS